MPTKKTSARKIPPQKSAVRRALKSPAKKSVSKSKAGPRKSTVKTPAARKAAPRKPAVKSATARQAAPKKAVVKSQAKRSAPATRQAQSKHTSRPVDPNRYNPSHVEQKWQQRWEQDGLYRTDFHDTRRPKFYFLTMYPYPSGDLHIGHWYAMSPSDAAARYRRMKGHNVFFPMGFDAFGLPAENAAIKRGIHPYKWTMKNIENMRRQLRSMGAMFDWSREVVTCMPDYYRWNQWFFLQFFKAGLAYKKMAPVDWCPKDQTVLAREQVIGPERLCERCDTPVIKKDLEQWFFRITKYADELLDFSKMQWPERVQTMQTNWIGRSEGAEIIFKTVDAYGGKSAGGSSPFGPMPQASPADALSARGTGGAGSIPAQTAGQVEPAGGSSPDFRTAAAPSRPDGMPASGSTPAKTAGQVEPAGGSSPDFRTAAAPSRPDGMPASGSREPAGEGILCFSTRPDTLCGATFIVLAPEHPLVDKLTLAEHRSEVERYVFEARRKTEIDREASDKDKTGLFIGAYAENPLNGAHIPIWIADYVLMGYGSGAIMGVPAHDTRDWEFATKFRLPILTVIAPPGWDGQPLNDAYTGEGPMVNSGEFDGMPSAEGKRAIAKKLEAMGAGKAAVTYRIRDWLISRQRYWGTPIPIIYCPEHGIVPVPEKDLPVVLPIDDSIKFNPEGQSPLLYHERFLNTSCPLCGKPARRETDTMDTFVDSSWYQFAYLGRRDGNAPFERELTDQWLPVDQYTGGIDHATMHLLYTRFFNKAMRDTTGLTEVEEPMTRLFNQGTILAPVEQAGEHAKKMSKSRGNVVAPDPLVQRYGADTVRAFLMFIGPWDQGGPWDDSGIDGVRKWINRAWSLLSEAPAAQRPAASPEQAKELRRAVHQTIKRVGDDMDTFKHNTAIAGLMELTNALARAKEAATYPGEVWAEAVRSLILMMAPITPHVGEELWSRCGGAYSVHQQMWPAYDAQAAAEDAFTLIVQVNGKVRDRAQAPVDIGDEGAKSLALATEGARKYLEGKKPRQVIYVKNKLVNIVV
jgi:leucyl-tRNA synthetase